MSYLLTVLIFFSIWVLLASSLNLVLGYTGLLSASHAGLMGIGAYAAALLSTRGGLDMTVAILVGALVAAAIGMLFSALTVRMGFNEFLLASVAFQIMIIEVIMRWSSFTGGGNGLSSIPRPEIFGTELTTIGSFAVYAVVAGIVGYGIISYVSWSPFALALRAVREKPDSVEALGKSQSWLKIASFGLGAGIAGLAGGVYASMVSFIHPTDFGIVLSIVVIAYVLVGGIGNMVGVVLGVAFLMAVPEIIAYFGFVPSRLVGPLENLVYGTIFILFVWFRPSGILPEKPVLRANGHSTRRGNCSGE